MISYLLTQIPVEIRPTILMEYTGYWIALGVMGLVVTFVVRINVMKDKIEKELRAEIKQCHINKMTDLKDSFSVTMKTSEMALQIAKIKEEVNGVYVYQKETVRDKLAEFTNTLNSIQKVIETLQHNCKK